MHNCPSRAELMSLLDSSLPEADERRLSAHLETCPTCSEMWDAECGQFAGPPNDAEVQLPDFLRRLQNTPPKADPAAIPSDGAERSPVHFPDPPTPLGPLGRV